MTQASETMKAEVTALLVQAAKVSADLEKILKGKSNLDKAKTIWTAQELKKVAKVIKNSSGVKLKALPVIKAAPAKKALPVKKAAPAKKALPVKKAAPAKKAVAVTKAASVKKAALTTNSEAKWQKEITKFTNQGKDTNDLFQKKVKTFDDILTLNILFLKGKLKKTPYHGSPIYDMDVSDLLELHKLGLITTEGQSNECYENRNITKGSNKGRFASLKQKSYLGGILRRNKQTEQFLQYLKEEAGQRNIKYKICFYPEKKNETNITEKINVTLDRIDNEKWDLFTNVQPGPMAIGVDYFDGKSKQILKSNSIELFVMKDEYCKGDVTKELLNMMTSFLVK